VELLRSFRLLVIGTVSSAVPRDRDQTGEE